MEKVIDNLKKRKKSTYDWQEIEAKIKVLVLDNKETDWPAILIDLNKLKAFDVGMKFPVKYLYRVFIKKVNQENVFLRDKVSLQFLNLWLSAFVYSPVFVDICRKFNSPRGNGINILTRHGARHLLILWGMEHYPALTKFIFGRKYFEQLSSLKGISFKQFINYAPAFVIFGLPRFIESPQKVIWVRWLAKGYNMRKANFLPFPLTKKMAHWMMHAPKFSSFKTAFLYGQVRALEGSDQLFNLMENNYRDCFNNYTLRKELIHFFVNNDISSNTQENRGLIGYIDHLHREQPGFSMKGRTLPALRRQAEHYYQGIQRRWNQEHYPQFWEGAPFKPFELKKNKAIYKIEQLKTYDELALEGESLHHCVSSYAFQCKYYGHSIWSLRKYTFEQEDGKQKPTKKMERLITIEVDAYKNIVQSRGNYNAMPSNEEKELIKKWAYLEQLNIVEF